MAKRITEKYGDPSSRPADDYVPPHVGTNPFVCKQVRLGGTAADIWALY